MAAVWRRTWGDTFFSSSDGQVCAAVAVYLAIRRSRASRLSGVPRRVMNSGSAGWPPRSASQARRTVDGGGGERGDSLLAALAQAADVRAGAQVDVADGQAGELGGAQPGLAGQHQQGVVAPPGPGGQVGGGQQGGDLVFGEVGDQGLVEALGRDGQDPRR